MEEAAQDFQADGNQDDGQNVVSVALDLGRHWREFHQCVIERLRLVADHLYQTVTDYQLHKAGTLGEALH